MDQDGDHSPLLRRRRLGVARGPGLSRFAAAQAPAGILKLSLLGSFSACIDDRPVAGLPKKAQALVAYVALHGERPIPREHLATLLWPENRNEQARRSLRDCLMTLRSAFGPAGADWLASEAASVCLSATHGVTIDVRRFEPGARATTVADLETAAALYREEFLHGLQITSEPFSEWMLVERRRLTALMSDLLYRLAGARAEAGNIEDAIEAAERLTTFDPLREDAYRLLMRLLGQSGRRAAALRQYARCVDTLRRELDVAPETATAALATSLRETVPCDLPVAGSKISVLPNVGHPAAGSPSAARNKASIAVLPFANLSGDAAEDYFADGIAEDVSVTLGRVPWLFVVGSGSTLPYRGRDSDIRCVGVGLGVQYVLRGSVRKHDGRLRIVVQLVDAAHGDHVWAERFDGELGDVFSIQDRVAAQVSATLAPALQSVEIGRSQHKPLANLSAYDLYLQALPKFRTTFEENRQALALLRQAVQLDPQAGAAYGLAARCYQFQRLFGWVIASDPRLQEGVRLAQIAGEVGKNDSEALWMAGIALAQLAGELEHGAALIERSLALNPNSASAWISGSFVLGEIGDADKALTYFDEAQRLNPLDSMHHIQWLAAGFAQMSAGRYREATDAIDRTLRARPSYTPAMRLKISLCGLLWEKSAGAEWVRRLLDVNPDASVAWFHTFWRLPLRHNLDLFDRMLEGARRAGLPEYGV